MPMYEIYEQGIDVVRCLKVHRTYPS